MYYTCMGGAGVSIREGDKDGVCTSAAVLKILLVGGSWCEYRYLYVYRLRFLGVC